MDVDEEQPLLGRSRHDVFLARQEGFSAASRCAFLVCGVCCHHPSFGFHHVFRIVLPPRMASRSTWNLVKEECRFFLALPT